MKNCRINVELALKIIKNDFIQRKKYIYEFYQNHVDIDYIFIVSEANNLLVKDEKREIFRKKISYFYGIRRSTEFTDKFIDLFIKLKKENFNALDLYDKINKELFQLKHNSKNQNEVSFTTKLLNLIDNRSPIYDNRVKGYFRINKILTQRSAKVDHNLFADLCNLYSKLKEKEYINNFKKLKNHFHESEKMKIILPIEKVIDNFLFSMGGDYLNKIKRLEKIGHID